VKLRGARAAATDYVKEIFHGHDEQGGNYTIVLAEIRSRFSRIQQKNDKSKISLGLETSKTTTSYTQQEITKILSNAWEHRYGGTDED
jgi:acyl-CoA thioesterase FadM